MEAVLYQAGSVVAAIHGLLSDEVPLVDWVAVLAPLGVETVKYIEGEEAEIGVCIAGIGSVFVPVCSAED